MSVNQVLKWMGVSSYGVETRVTPVSGERITAETRLAGERMRGGEPGRAQKFRNKFDF